MTRRHRWSAPVRFARKSERACLNGCGTVRVTRHEPGPPERHWVEFWREDGDGCPERIEGAATPPCDGAPSHPAAARPPSTAKERT